MAIWVLTDRAIHQLDGYLTRVNLIASIARGVSEEEIVFIAPVGGVELKHTRADALELLPPFRRSTELIARLPMLLLHLLRLGKKRGRPSCIVAENLPAAPLGASLARLWRIPFVFDYHGVVPEEVALGRRRPAALAIEQVGRWLERVSYRAASLTLVVSESFREAMKERHGRVSGRVEVLPMVVEASMLDSPRPCPAAARIPKDRIVFAYCGSTFAWQLVEPMIECYKQLEERAPVFLMVLSRDRETFEALLKRHRVQHYLLESVPHDEVPSYLWLADHGFVLRGPSIVNRVSSPTKVMEYLSCGVAPVMTEHVGDFSRLLANTELADVIPYGTLLREGLRGFNPRKRTSALAELRRRFVHDTIARHRGQVSAALAGLLGGAG